MPPRSVEQILPSGEVPAWWLCMEDGLEGALQWLLSADCNAMRAAVARLRSKISSRSSITLKQEVYTSSWSDHLWFGL